MRKDRVIADILGEENVLTPSDLYNKEFRRTLGGGYVRSEVDEFLERVADVFENLIVQVRMLKERCEEQKERLEEYRQMESSLRSALVSSQQFGQDMLEAAKRQADALLEEARLTKQQMELEAARTPQTLSREIEALLEQRRRLRAEILTVLDVHRRVIENLTSDAGPLSGGVVAEQGTRQKTTSEELPIPEEYADARDTAEDTELSRKPAPGSPVTDKKKERTETW